MLGQDKIDVETVIDVIKVSVGEQHRTKVQTELSQTGVRVTPSQAAK